MTGLARELHLIESEAAAATGVPQLRYFWERPSLETLTFFAVWPKIACRRENRLVVNTCYWIVGKGNRA